MKRISVLILLSIFFCVPACVQKTPFPDTLNVFEQPPKKRTDPPTYIRIFDETVSPLMNQKVNVNFLPGNVVLQTAIVSGIPFPVTVIAQDDYVDLQRVVAVQAYQTTVQSYLQQLEGITGYRIRLRPDEKIVEVSGLVTQTWNLSALAGIGNFNARLGFDSGDNEEDEDQSSSQTGYEMRTEISHNDDVWTSVIEHAACILGIQVCGGSEDNEQLTDREQTLDRTAWLVNNQRLGTITAGGKPLKITYLDQWLQRLSEESLRSVQLDCVIFDIAKNHVDSFGLDLDAVFGGDDAISVEFSGDDSDNRNPWTLGALISEGNFNMDLLIRSLTQKSSAEIKSRARLAVTNGATAYLNTGEVFSYISGTEAVAAEGVATTSFEQKRLQVGLELAVTPRIVDKNGRILVEVIPILSSLLRFDTLNSGDNQINTPVITLRQLSSQAVTQSGHPIIIGGLSLDRLSRQQSSPSSHLPFHALLSSRDKELESRQLLIVITPRIVSA